WETRGATWLLPDCLTGVSLCLGIAAGIVAARAGLWSTSEALLAASALAGYGGSLILARGRLSFRGRWVVSWGAVFVLLLMGVSTLLPAYHRRFSLRGQVRRHAADGSVPVVCYPRRWDGVGFYLGRSDILVHDECSSLLADLADRDRALAFIKNRGYLAKFLSELPPHLEFLPCARQGPNVVSGFVRRKIECADQTLLTAHARRTGMPTPQHSR